MGEVLQLPGGRPIWRVRVDFGGGIVACVDVLKQPDPWFIAETELALSKLLPSLVEVDTVLLQFGPVGNIDKGNQAQRGGG